MVFHEEYWLNIFVKEQFPVFLNVILAALLNYNLNAMKDAPLSDFSYPIRVAQPHHSPV